MPTPNWNRRSVLLSLAAGMMPAAIPAQPGRPAETSTVEQALCAFLQAFDNLDWQAFQACFAPGVTMFHPAPPNIKRIDTQQAFEKAWLGVFARIRKQSGRDQPPYMNLEPQDLRIESLAPEIALATFHLIDGPIVSRRSVLLKQYADGWKIVHLHASNLTDTPK